jgi:hypothetical protein
MRAPLTTAPAWIDVTEESAGLSSVASACFPLNVT